MAGRKKPSSSMLGEEGNAMEEHLHGVRHHHFLVRAFFVEALYAMEVVGKRMRTHLERRDGGGRRRNTQRIKKPRLSGMNST